MAQTTPSRSSLLAEYFSFEEIRKRDTKAMATQPSREFRFNSAHGPDVVASQTSRVSMFWSNAYSV